MSHFSEVKTNLKNEKVLKTALSKLGYQIEEQPDGVEVRGFFGDTVAADFKILTNSNYDIGFKKTESGNYEVLGDWSLMPKVAGIEEEEFTRGLKKEYARAAITEIAQSKGYEIEVSEDNESNSIEMVVTQW